MVITTRTLLTSGPTTLIFPTPLRHDLQPMLLFIALASSILMLSKYLGSIPRGTQYSYCYDHTIARVECPRSSSLARDIASLVVRFGALFMGQRGFYELIMACIEEAEEQKVGNGEGEAE